ncbi:MAG TPA: heavy metal-binding domain-containing protein [Burkholderiaceae bacterium]
MGLFDLFKGTSPEQRALREASERRQAGILAAVKRGGVPQETRARLEAARDGRIPWVATLTPAELLIARTHGVRPVAAVSATCWMHYGFSWTLGHQQGWQTALRRLKDEARAAGANAVLDVKMRTLPLEFENSMDFTLVGTAVKMDGLPASADPIVATVPALEFIKLAEADVVPTGIAIGAHYEWWADARQRTVVWGNRELPALTGLWERVRRQAHGELRTSARPQGNGVLAHVNFSQIFEVEDGEDRPKRYLARHIVVATTVDATRATLRHPIEMAVDMCDGPTPLVGTRGHHQSYASNESDEAI